MYLILILLALLALPGCGGGGVGGGEPPIENNDSWNQLNWNEGRWQ